MNNTMNRREFVAGVSASLLCAALPLEAAPAAPRPISLFEKPFAFLSNAELASVVSRLGYSGIEATVRVEQGRVLPKNVEEDLPRLHDALQKRGLEITSMATDITGVDQPYTERVLRTASKLGIRRYRMMYYFYDTSKPIIPQLDAFGARLRPLVDLTRELGMTAIYQNHSSPDRVGAPVWDMYQLLKDYDPKTIGFAFDIMHAKVEGGMSWPIQFKLVQSHLAAVYVKDFRWENGKVKNMPLGEGWVDRPFYQLLRQSGFAGPIFIHIEYLEGKNDTQALESAFGKDLATLRSLMEG